MSQTTLHPTPYPNSSPFSGYYSDELIDEIVYEFYGLTDEEIEIVGEAVGQ
jgi:hypothetical protein